MLLVHFGRVVVMVISAMDTFEKRLQEEIEFWRAQIDLASKRQDEEALPRLRDALKFVEFKLQRLRGPNPGDGPA